MSSFFFPPKTFPTHVQNQHICGWVTFHSCLWWSYYDMWRPHTIRGLIKHEVQLGKSAVYAMESRHRYQQTRNCTKFYGSEWNKKKKILSVFVRSETRLSCSVRVLIKQSSSYVFLYSDCPCGYWYITWTGLVQASISWKKVNKRTC